MAKSVSCSVFIIPLEGLDSVCRMFLHMLNPQIRVYKCFYFYHYKIVNIYVDEPGGGHPTPSTKKTSIEKMSSAINRKKFPQHKRLDQVG